MALFVGNVAYCVAALLSGWLADVIKPQTVIVCVGLCWIAAGMYMFGPVGWPFPVQLNVVLVGLVIGFWGASFVMVPLFPYLSDCAGTSSSVQASALFCACYQLGSIVGHIVSTHAYNIRTAVATWSVAAIVLALWTAILTIASKSRTMTFKTPPKHFD